MFNTKYSSGWYSLMSHFLNRRISSQWTIDPRRSWYLSVSLFSRAHRYRPSAAWGAETHSCASSVLRVLGPGEEHMQDQRRSFRKTGFSKIQNLPMG